ncbi:hypothetical protein D8674_021917 [Pyrus ussuriensis x Pyrus communis]|uniref:Uncharacterized protein n=1 Tax=Pyrus ussuriensis x Pyrus communis TaxID=2448454 RepID=A0A5N5GIH1_9ROSA|nr:hypothetical protein D8674_021917 [Pyrus ussuriensis x Pyrus communis]
MLASPFYADFVVDGEESGVLSVSAGPSNMSMPYAIDGILNGIEIIRLNSMGSLGSKHCGGWVVRNWPKGNVGAAVPLVAAACLLLLAGWSKLPTSVSKVILKHGNAQFLVK